MFCEMGHWYSWASPYFILKKMTFSQFLLYYGYIPAEGRVTTKKTQDNTTDYMAIKKFMGGKKIKSR